MCMGEGDHGINRCVWGKGDKLLGQIMATKSIQDHLLQDCTLHPKIVWPDVVGGGGGGVRCKL